MKNIHIIPTDKPSRLSDCHNNNLYLDDVRYLRNYKNIYITNSEEIKEGVEQWYLDKVLNEPYNSGGAQYSSKQDVIILTTDQNLIIDSVQAIPDEFLDWIIKNPSCEEVEVITEYNCPVMNKTYDKPYMTYKIIIPKEEPNENILINHFDEEFVELFNPLNKSLGLINKYQLLDIQCQIAEKRLYGYYITIKDLKCPIDNQGEIQNWDDNTFDRKYRMLLKLKQIQEKNETRYFRS